LQAVNGWQIVLKGGYKVAKYKNEKITVDGYRFDSKVEAKFYDKLKMDKSMGLIINFELQPRFILQPKFIKMGIRYRAIELKADFTIYHLNGDIEIIDIKGMATPESKLKRKIFNATYENVLTWLVWSGGQWLEYDDVIKARAKRKKAKNDK
jgi:hypothetical protein